MDNERDEQVVFIRDLLFAVLYQWRKILAAALVLAVLLGGFKAISGYFAMPDAGTQETAQAEYREKLAKYEAQKASLEQSIATIERNIMGQKTYLEGSILMGLDPYAFYEATMELYIDTDYQIMPDKLYQDPDYSSAVLLAYQTALGGGKVMEQTAAAMGLERQYLVELVKVSAGTTTGALNHIVTVTVRYPDAEGAEKILTLLEGQLDAVKAQVTQSIGDHTVSLIAKTCGLRSDVSLVNTQKAETDRVNTLANDLEKAKTSLNNLTKPGNADYSGTGVLKSAVKYGIVGAAAGVFLVALGACVAHVANGKVYSQRTLEACSAVNVIGRLEIPGKKRKNPIDRWLRRLEGRAEDQPDTDRLMTATVGSRCQGVKTLLLTGDVEPEMTRALAARLSLKDVTLIPCGSLLRDPGAVEALAGCDGVLFAELRGCSKYENITRARTLVCQQGKQLLGCILFE